MQLNQLPPELENKPLEVGKIYEIEYVIPDSEFLDRTKLYKTIAEIETNIINSDQLQHVSPSKLVGNSLFVYIKIKSPATETAGLGVVPLVIIGGIVLFATLLPLLTALGLKWSVKSIKEISQPIVQITTSLLPIALIIGAIVLLPQLLPYVPKRR
jgi:hypothetical protein